MTTIGADTAVYQLTVEVYTIEKRPLGIYKFGLIFLYLRTACWE